VVRGPLTAVGGLLTVVGGPLTVVGGPLTVVRGHSLTNKILQSPEIFIFGGLKHCLKQSRHEFCKSAFGNALFLNFSHSYWFWELKLHNVETIAYSSFADF
jgi:hypothetical protein